MILRTNSINIVQLCLPTINMSNVASTTSASISGHDAIADDNGFYIVDENNNYIND